MQGLLEYGFTAFGERVSVAEFVGQVCALLVVFLARRRTLWTWPVQVLATVLLLAVYTSAHLGGLAARQVVIFAISVYGWWAWTRRKDALYGVAVRTGTKTERLVLVVALVVGTVATALLLSAWGASWAPWPDAWIFIGSVVTFAGTGAQVGRVLDCLAGGGRGRRAAADRIRLVFQRRGVCGIRCPGYSRLAGMATHSQPARRHGHAGSFFSMTSSVSVKGAPERDAEVCAEFHGPTATS